MFIASEWKDCCYYLNYSSHHWLQLLTCGRIFIHIYISSAQQSSLWCHNILTTPQLSQADNLVVFDTPHLFHNQIFLFYFLFCLCLLVITLCSYSIFQSWWRKEEGYGIWHDLTLCIFRKLYDHWYLWDFALFYVLHYGTYSAAKGGQFTIGLRELLFCSLAFNIVESYLLRQKISFPYSGKLNMNMHSYF